jgi:hypothetical protein
MAGVLDYKRYLNTLQTITDWGNTFPSTQETYVFSVEGGVTSSWTATIQWQTLLVDQIVWDRNQQPTFNNSQVIGYFESSAGTSTQYSTGVISIPANMYTGPILPTSDRYVPVTIVNLSWTDGTETYDHQLGLIQNYEPGVTISNPYDSDDFEPVEPIASTLTLSLDTPAIYGDPFTVRAESDLPIEISPSNVCSFFATSSTGGTFLLTTATFTGLIASKEITAVTPLTATNYVVFAEFGGQREYGRTRSNTATLQVVSGIPLVAVDELFTPSQSYYFPGNTFNYRLTVDAAPGFTATTTIANTVTVSIVNQFPPNSSSTGFTGIFADGVATATFTVTNTMIDTGIIHTGTQYTLLSYTNNTTTFTATVFVSNTSTINSQWLSYRPGRYAAGSHNKSVNVASTISKTLSINSFPISISQTYTATLFGETLPLPVVTVSTPYFNNVSIFAVSVAAPTTHVLLNASNNSGTSTYTVNTTALTTGTWTIYASYPGDLGSSVFFVNAASTSNNLTHVVKAGNTLGAVLNLVRTDQYDILHVWASTSTTLTQTVSFLDGVSVLGTSTWTRYSNTVSSSTVWYQGGSIAIAKVANNFSSLFAANTGNFYVSPLASYGLGWVSNEQTATNYIANRTSLSDFPVRNPNAWRTWKYYDGSNYNLSAVTGTDITPLLDTIITGTTWTYDIGANLPAPSGVVIGRTVDGREGYIYFDTTIPLINIYKTDEIGDYRGYNVVAIDADSGIARPPVENGPIRLTWNYNPTRTSNPTNPVYTATNFIDLVEYIGFVQWQKPQPDGSTVGAWLFRFTPEVRQSPDLLFRRLNPLDEAYQELLDPSLPQAIRIPDTNPLSFNPTGFRWTQFPVGSFTDANGSRPRSGDLFVAPEDNRTWTLYGKKYWPSLNPSDPTENFYSTFCQQWYWMNTSDEVEVNRRVGFTTYDYRDPFQVNVASVFTATEVVSTSNIQLATLYLPAGTITTSTGIHATWPGTTNLSAYFGKFEPFDIYVTSSTYTTSIVAERFVTESYNTSTNSPSIVVSRSGERIPSIGRYYQASTGTYTANATATATTVVYSTNPVNLKITIDTTDKYIFPTGVNTGTINVINVATGAVLTSTNNIVNGEANVLVTAEQITNRFDGPIIPLRAVYSNTSTIYSTGTVFNLQAVRANMTMNNIDFSYTTPVAFGTVPMQPEFSVSTPVQPYKVPQIFGLKIASVTNPGSGINRANGSLNLLLPKLDYTGQFVKGLNTTTAVWSGYIGNDGGETMFFGFGDKLIDVYKSTNTWMIDLYYKIGDPLPTNPSTPPAFPTVGPVNIAGLPFPTYGTVFGNYPSRRYVLQSASTTNGPISVSLGIRPDITVSPGQTIHFYCDIRGWVSNDAMPNDPTNWFIENNPKYAWIPTTIAPVGANSKIGTTATIYFA